MAKIGLKYPVYKSETNCGVIGSAIQADITIELNNTKLYGDDKIIEQDRSFKSGTITLGIDDLSDTVQKEFLGHTVSSGETTAKGSDDYPYIGIGFYGTKIVSGIKKYRAIWFPKVQFSEPEDSNRTKGESTEFATPTIEGGIFEDNGGVWKLEKTFNTEAEAITYLQTKSGLAQKSAPVTSSVASGTYTAAQDVVLSTTEATGTIYYTTDGTIPSATNGTEYSAEIELAKPSNTCIKAVCVTAGKVNSDILELYITVTA